MAEEEKEYGCIILSGSYCKACDALKNWMDGEKLKYWTLNIEEDDEAADLLSKYKIRGIPAVFIFDEREEVVDYKVGWSEDTKTWIKSYIRC